MLNEALGDIDGDLLGLILKDFDGDLLKLSEAEGLKLELGLTLDELLGDSLALGDKLDDEEGDSLADTNSVSRLPTV